MDQDSVHMMATSKVPMLKLERFGGNAATKKTLMNIPKEALEIYGETVSQEDVNHKSLRSLSPEWNTHTIMWRNKPEIDTLILDDLYNNMKIYEPEVKGTSSSSTNIQNIAFMSLNSTSSTNGAVTTALSATTASTQATTINSTTINNLSDAIICAFFASQPNSLQLDNEDLQQIHPGDIKEMDLRWQMAMLTMRARKFLKYTRRKFSMNGLESVEARLLVYKKNESVYKEDIKVLKCKIHLREVAIIELRRKLDLAQKQNDEIQLTVENFENSSKNLSKLLDYQIVDKCKTGLGYNDVLPPYTRNFMPPKHDLSFSSLEEFINKPIVSEPTVKKHVVETSEAKVEDVPQAKKEKKIVKSSFVNRVVKSKGETTKDETSGILKSFITGVEILIDQKVKVIRCDNETEFKNKEMNQFCERKGIKREFSIARTPQQNGVAKRKNRTLIEAARTMLADFKLPTTFWIEAVNTACYVQNKVLVTKPHNKTPYELFLGRKPSLGFMRQFGCPVIILNTIDHLGKLDGKADEGFFVGYSINSKAFRVFNSRTRIVEENLHV
ncbi:ribonuclease H-like domain-containing protein [Tanacetum coccineum]